MGGRGLFCIIAAIGLANNVHPALGAVTIQDPGTYVVDRAKIIDDGVERQMEGWLRELEQKTTAQVKVLTVPTTDGEDFFTFVQRHAVLWKLGRADRDNGVLIGVAMKEREDRIHVGYGLEGVLPDSWCGSLRRQDIVPNFKQGRFSDGLYQAVVAVANKIADDANVSLTGIPDFRHRQGRVAPRGVKCGAGLVPIIVLILVVSAMSRRRRHYGRWGGGGLARGLFWGSVINSMMSSGRRSGGRGFGGGFGGGGFGGSFGGGGGFGGGGAGGRW